MTALLKVFDEHFGSDGSKRTPGVHLHLASERVTAREIIRRRVEAEVQATNQRSRARAGDMSKTRSLIIETDPSSAEAVLNTWALGKRAPRRLDVEKETARAITAFGKRHFLMLLDDRQIDDLDEEQTIMPGSEIVFLYLTPLRGG